jgi:hypothetical protein
MLLGNIWEVLMMGMKWLSSLTLGIALAALPALAQDPNSAPAADPQAPSGWRRFEGSQPPQQGDQAPPAQYDAGPAPGQLVLPAGTLLTVRVNQPLSSDHNQKDDAFTASLAQPLVTNGFVIARRGQMIQGRVVEAQKAGRVTGTSRLGLELDQLTLVDGQQIPVQTQLVERRGDTSVGRDAAAIGATTGVGAAIGAAAAGGMGAGIGAGAGALASVLGVMVTRGHPTVVYPEMMLTFRLANPVTISTERSSMAFQPVNPQDYAQPTMVRRGPPPGYPPPPPYYAGYYGYPYAYPYYYGYGPRFYFYGGPRFYRRW